MLLVGNLLADAQHHINSFFEDHGIVALETQELRDDTVITVFHRKEDVVWSRVVYSIIDMRYKQNFELYFPINPTNPKYQSLFHLTLVAIAEGNVPVYAKPANPEDGLIPNFMQVQPLSMEDIKNQLDSEGESEDIELSPTTGDGEEGSAANENGEPVVATVIDNNASIYEFNNEGKLQIRDDYYKAYVPNQYKYLIQEVIFFDKHYSRLYRQIMAVAPLYTPKSTERDQPYEALYKQIVFWIPFKYLRPHMAHQHMISSKNSTKRLTFDEFFAKRLYASYLVGEDNIYDRVIPQYLRTEPELKKEQKRIETELLNFEQDLWEY